MSNYNTFSGEDLKIADLILHRRLQLLVHSCIYYELNQNIITDAQWNDWANELTDLQGKYPEISSKVEWAEAFKDWDGSTGAFLPLMDTWVLSRAAYLLKLANKHTIVKLVTAEEQKPKPKSVPKKPTSSKSLF